MLKRKIKVLYVGYTSIGDGDATGNTLKSIFSQLSDELIIQQLSLDYASQFHVNNYPTCFVSPLKSLCYYLMKSLYRSDTVQKNKTEAFADAKRIGGNPMVAFLRGLLDILPKRYTKFDYQSIRLFEPDIIYTLGENISTLKIAISCSIQFNCPIVLHMMDNIEDCVYNYSYLTRPFRLRYLKLLNKLYERSVGNLAISPKMAAEFSNRHNCPFSYAMNSINEIYSKTYTPFFCKKESLSIVFSGGLHGGRANTLAKIEDIIYRNDFLRNHFDLTIFTSEENISLYRSVFREESILNVYVPKEQMFANLSKYDLLLHVESFDPDEIEFFRYSMSTKIPEYLSVGRTIMCVGPMEICSVSFLSESDAAIVVNDIKRLPDFLADVYNNQELLNQYSRNAVKVANNEFLSLSVTKRVLDLFMRCIKEWKNT